MQKTIDLLQKRIHEENSFFLFCHVSPDGDALGSALGLSIALRSMGKRVRVFCADPVPERLSFLPFSGEILQSPPSAQVPQRTCAIALDTADLLRLGSCQELFSSCATSICIDHHGTNEGYGELNLIMPEAAATCEIVTYIYQSLEWPMTPEAALCLFTGLSTDTGHFQFENTTGNTLRAAAQLLDVGIHISSLTRQLYRVKRIEHTRLRARAIQSLRLFENDRAAIMVLSRNDFIAADAQDSDAEAIIDEGMHVNGVQIAALLRVSADGIKVSLRCSAPHRVDEVAQRLGGGGHPRAAGAVIDAPMDEAVERVMQSMTNALRGTEE